MILQNDAKDLLKKLKDGETVGQPQLARDSPTVADQLKLWLKNLKAGDYIMI